MVTIIVLAIYFIILYFTGDCKGAASVAVLAVTAAVRQENQ